VGREVTLQTTALKNLMQEGIAHEGFSFVEVISDCTEIYGRKNELGSSPEMVLSQKRSILPKFDGTSVDKPFRAGNWDTGVLMRADRPEYYQAYRDHCRKVLAAQRGKQT
jgi:2-oxoglutarate ferredoxin oxidoreductase subunit beta